jgi:hypothetical protein
MIQPPQATPGSEQRGASAAHGVVVLEHRGRRRQEWVCVVADGSADETEDPELVGV